MKQLTTDSLQQSPFSQSTEDAQPISLSPPTLLESSDSREVTPKATWSEFARSRRLRSKGERVTETIEKLPLSCISTAKIKNCREAEDTAKFEALKSSIVSEGLLQPVLVERDPHVTNHFFLIAGFRRMRAVRELGRTTIRATVIVTEGECDKQLVNLLENMARAEPSTYELAKQCEYIINRFGVSERELAERLGVTPPYVHNLTRYVSTLPSNVLEDWKNQHPCATMKCLQRLASPTLLPFAAEEWEKVRNKRSKDDLKPEETLQQVLERKMSEEDDGSDGHAPSKRPSKARLSKVRDVAARARLPADPVKVRALVLGLIDYARGISRTIPGLTI
jgi:ParB/RepB/Spo0J family partition protein